MTRMTSDEQVAAYRSGVDDWYDPEKTTEDLYPSPHENGLRAVADAAERRVLFEYGREFEREHRKKVEAAAKRLAVDNAALNKKLAEWPEEDDHGDG